MLLAPAPDPVQRIIARASWHSWFAWRPVRAGGRIVWLRWLRRRLTRPGAFLFWHQGARYCPSPNAQNANAQNANAPSAHASPPCTVFPCPACVPGALGCAAG